ncbi:MAG: FadR family transcriptional regulator [Clostridiales bacterium]|nr:FadR family transcriptional regulator [Clostridiales bacterium]
MRYTPKIEVGSRCYEQVIDYIKGMIARGELKQGDRLPSERRLAEQLNVSRVPVREALKILEYMGLLDSNQGDGTYVKKNNMKELFYKMNFVTTVTAETLRDLLELRVDLESFAAYNAAKRRTQEDIDKLQETIVNMREAKKGQLTDDNIQRLRQMSHNFHRYMVQAAHNAVLVSVYENLYELLDISRQFTIDSSGISYDSMMAHEVIFNRIVQRDAEGARDAIQEHLGDVKINLALKLEEAKFEEEELEDEMLDCRMSNG